MKSLYDVGVFDKIFHHVLAECEMRGIDGVFAMAERPSRFSHESAIHYRRVRRESIIDYAWDGKKYNLLAIVLAKVSAVLAHCVPSGGDVKYVGEVPYRGGLPSKDGSCVYAFSGGTEDQDVEIAQLAHEFHGSLK